MVHMIHELDLTADYIFIEAKMDINAVQCFRAM